VIDAVYQTEWRALNGGAPRSLRTRAHFHPGPLTAYSAELLQAGSLLGLTLTVGTVTSRRRSGRASWLSYAVAYLFVANVWANHHHLVRFATAATPRLFFLVNSTYIFLIRGLIDRRPIHDVPAKARRIMRVRSLPTLCLFGTAAVLALRRRRLETAASANPSMVAGPAGTTRGRTRTPTLLGLRKTHVPGARQGGITCPPTKW
jgi:hypothetical protein